MTDEDDDITLWMERLADQPEAAAEKIWARYYDRLVSYADRQLGSTPRRSGDEEDIALSAMHSLHEGVRQGKFPEFRNRDDLWKLLLTIARRKVKKSIRRAMTQKRGGGNVRGESVFGLRNDEQAGIEGIEGADPTPQFAEQLSAETDELIKSLKDPKLELVAILKLQGFSNGEIADQLGCSIRSVERKLSRIRDSWQSVVID